jgi:pseudaminic acid cytidylyltransferase
LEIKVKRMENLAIIPARGGSKRIPKKNIISFFDKPLISYSINTAIKSELFKEVMVSTDDHEIADISIEFGAKVPFFRSKKNSNDYAVLSDVVDEVISEYKKIGRRFDFVCCILPTSPLITIENLKKGFELIHNGQWNTTRPVVRYSYPIQRALYLKSGQVDFIHPENAKKRSQDLEPAFHDAGQFYWAYFEKGMVSEEKGGFEISEMEAQDIDTYSDLEITKLKFKLLNDSFDKKSF